jgi:hypothetical protein
MQPVLASGVRGIYSAHHHGTGESPNSWRAAPTRDEPHQRVREEGGRPGNPRATIGSGRLPRVTSNRTCLAAFRGSRERGRRVPGCKPEPPTPVTRPRSPERLRPRTPLEDPPRPRLIDVCKLTKKSVIRGACSNLVRCYPRSCPVRPGPSASVPIAKPACSMPRREACGPSPRLVLKNLCSLAMIPLPLRDLLLG